MAPETFLGDSGQEPSKAGCVSPLRDPLLSSRGQVGVQRQPDRLSVSVLFTDTCKACPWEIPPSLDQKSQVMGSGP